jgi:hypothetical protein
VLGVFLAHPRVVHADMASGTNDDNYVYTEAYVWVDSPITISGVPLNAVIDEVEFCWNVDSNFVSDVDYYLSTSGYSSSVDGMQATGDDGGDEYSETSLDCETVYPGPSVALSGVWTFHIQDTFNDSNPDWNTGRIDWWNILIHYHIPSPPTPMPPTGTSPAWTGTAETYTTGGSTCSVGGPVEYQFDWGDGNQSAWDTSASQSYAWDTADTHEVSARARCAGFPDVVSDWSAPLPITVYLTLNSVGATVNGFPTGDSVPLGSPITLSGSGSVVGSGTLECWWELFAGGGWSFISGCGAGGQVDILAIGGSPIISALSMDPPQFLGIWEYRMVFSSGGMYLTSLSVYVTVHNEASPPDQPTGPSSGLVGETRDFSSGGSVCLDYGPVEYQFDWDDGTQSPWSTATTQAYAWSTTGTYDVRAHARCENDPSYVSDWSSPQPVIILLEVTIDEQQLFNAMADTIATNGATADIDFALPNLVPGGIALTVRVQDVIGDVLVNVESNEGFATFQLGETTVGGAPAPADYVDAIQRELMPLLIDSLDMLFAPYFAPEGDLKSMVITDREIQFSQTIP